MIRVLLSFEMRLLETETIRLQNVGEDALVVEAARAIFQSLLKIVGEKPTGPIALVAGKGLNGADALCVAILCAERGIPIWVAAFPPKNSNSWIWNLHRKLDQHKIPIFTPPLDANNLGSETKCHLPIPKNCCLIVDGLLGTGLSRAAAGIEEIWIGDMNRSGHPILSIDLPSGMYCDKLTSTTLSKKLREATSSEKPCAIVGATYTLSLGSPKLSTFFYPDRCHTGKLLFHPLSFDESIHRSNPQKTELYFPDLNKVPGWLKARTPTSHKYANGKVLVIAGSLGMQGAALLCAHSALRAGAGIVRLVHPMGISGAIAPYTWEIVGSPVGGGDDTHFKPEHLYDILPLLEWADVCVLGPGLSRHPDVLNFLNALAPHLRPKTIIDGDGLNIDFVKITTDQIIATPHHGEYQKALGGNLGKPCEPLSLIENAAELAQKFKISLLLKGPTSIFVHQNRCSILPFGSPTLATAGSGDVLAGLLAALWVSMPTEQAAITAVSCHGGAGNRASNNKGRRGVIARDLLDGLAEIWVEWDKRTISNILPHTEHKNQSTSPPIELHFSL